MRHERWEGVSRVLAVYPEMAGIATLGPALRELRRVLPGATVTLLAPAGSGVLPPGVDDGIPWPPFPDGGGLRTLVEVLRAGRFDAALVFTAPGGSPHVAGYLCFLAGVPTRLGLSREFAGKVLSGCFPPPEGADAAERHLFLLEAAGLRAVREVHAVPHDTPGDGSAARHEPPREPPRGHEGRT